MAGRLPAPKPHGWGQEISRASSEPSRERNHVHSCIAFNTESRFMEGAG